MMKKLWKSGEQIEEEKRLLEEERKKQEALPTSEERVDMLEQTIMMLMMEGLNGGEK